MSFKEWWTRHMVAIAMAEGGDHQTALSMLSDLPAEEIRKHADQKVVRKSERSVLRASPPDPR